MEAEKRTRYENSFGKNFFGLNKTGDKVLATKYDMVGSNFAGFKTMSDYIAIGDRVDNALFYKSPKIEALDGNFYFDHQFGEVAVRVQVKPAQGLLQQRSRWLELMAS